MEKLFKVVSTTGDPLYGGKGQWSLPTEKGPGEWRKVTGPLVPCKNGLHLCYQSSLIEWLGPAIYLAEARGEILEESDKVVAREARLIKHLPWDEHIAREFACDCAERVISYYESLFHDNRVRKAISVSRRFARGQATVPELVTAYTDADLATMEARIEARAASKNGREATHPAYWVAWAAAYAIVPVANQDAFEAAWNTVFRVRDVFTRILDTKYDAECLWQETHLTSMLGLSAD